MSEYRQSIREYIRASEKLLEMMHDLTEEETIVVNDILDRVSRLSDRRSPDTERDGHA